MNPTREDISSKLFQWKSCGPKISKKKSENENKIWSKKTEAVVEDAVSIAMGQKQASNKHLLHDDHVYAEARSLLNKWISDKNTAEYTVTSEDDLIDYGGWSDMQGVTGIPQRYQIKKEWDHLMKDLEDEACHRIFPSKRNVGTTLNGDDDKKNASTNCESYGAKSMGTMYEHPFPRRNVGIDCEDWSFPHRDAATQQLDEDAWRTPIADYGDEDDESDMGENVQDIMKRLMEREYVPKSKLREKEHPIKVDLKLKMDLRQEQARQKREEKRKLEEDRRKDIIAKREAEVAARKILLDEERDRISKMKREEELIQKEMVKIRKEMNEKRQQDEQLQQKEFERIVQLQKIIDDAPGRPLPSSSRSGRKSDAPVSTPSTARLKGQEIEKRKEKIALKIAAKEKKNLIQTKQLLSECFYSWYSVVINRRMKMKEVSTIADWKLLQRYFQSWHNWYRSSKLEREIKQKELDAKNEQRKLHVADNFRKICLLRKYFLAWRLDNCREKELKSAADFEAKAKSKMAAFLEAAESGRLPIANNEEAAANISKPTKAPKQRNVVMRNIANKNKPQEETKYDSTSSNGVNHNCDQMPDSSRPDDCDETISRKKSSAYKTAGNNSTQIRVPTEAWQVHRGHVYLPLEELLATDEQAEKEENQEICSARHSISNRGQNQQQSARRSLRPPKMVNTFENRHKSQQKILQDQQQRIKEQQRLIEDLQSNQRRQQLDLEIQTKHLTNTILENVTAKLPPMVKPAFGDLRKLDRGLVVEDLDCENEDEEKTVCRQSERSHIQTRREQKKNAFVKKMEDRATERARMKQEREERKRQIEEERLQKLEEMAAEQNKIEEELRQAKLIEIREKKRLEREREQERLGRLEKMKELNILAIAHRNKVLLKKYGWNAWRALIERKRRNEIRAQEFYSHKLTSITFDAWYLHTQEVLEAEDDLVHTFYTTLLLRRCFYRLKMHQYRIERMEIGAIQWHHEHIYRDCFHAWKDHAVQMKFDRREREVEADQFNHRRLLKSCFHAWRQFPKILAAEKEKEKRKEELRRKVAALVPDYSPV